MIGQYLCLVDMGSLSEAGKLLDFQSLPPRFHQTGVTPNATDSQCAQRIAEVVIQPL